MAAAAVVVIVSDDSGDEGVRGYHRSGAWAALPRLVPAAAAAASRAPRRDVTQISSDDNDNDNENAVRGAERRAKLYRKRTAAAVADQRNARQSITDLRGRAPAQDNEQRAYLVIDDAPPAAAATITHRPVPAAARAVRVDVQLVAAKTPPVVAVAAAAAAEVVPVPDEEQWEQWPTVDADVDVDAEWGAAAAAAVTEQDGSQLAAWAPSPPPLSDCIICFEPLSADAVFIVDGCRHCLCQDCATQHVRLQLEGESGTGVPCPALVTGTNKPCEHEINVDQITNLLALADVPNAAELMARHSERLFERKLKAEGEFVPCPRILTHEEETALEAKTRGSAPTAAAAAVAAVVVADEDGDEEDDDTFLARLAATAEEAMDRGGLEAAAHALGTAAKTAPKSAAAAARGTANAGDEGEDGQPAAKRRKRACGGYAQVQGERKAVCLHCEFAFCPQCGLPAHDDSCDAARQRAAAGADEAEAAYHAWRAETGTRACPSCGQDVERSSGCNRITCRCGTMFCYLCGEAGKTAQDVYQHLNEAHAGRIYDPGMAAQALAQQRAQAPQHPAQRLEHLARERAQLQQEAQLRAHLLAAQAKAALRARAKQAKAEAKQAKVEAKAAARGGARAGARGGAGARHETPGEMHARLVLEAARTAGQRAPVQPPAAQPGGVLDALHAQREEIQHHIQNLAQGRRAHGDLHAHLQELMDRHARLMNEAIQRN